MVYLSIKYDILFQWNKDGLVDIIVMWKMVSSSFMKVKEARNLLLPPQPGNTSNCFGLSPHLTRNKCIVRKYGHSYMVRDIVDNELAILESTDDSSSSGTEVALVKPPYIVSWPSIFPPTTTTTEGQQTELPNFPGPPPSIKRIINTRQEK